MSDLKNSFNLLTNFFLKMLLKRRRRFRSHPKEAHKIRKSFFIGCFKVNNSYELLQGIEFLPQTQIFDTLYLCNPIVKTFETSNKDH